MSEPISPPPAAATPETNPVRTETGGFNLDAAEVASMRETWVAAGLDPAKFDAAAAGGLSAPLPVNASAPLVLNDLKTPTLSQSEARELAASLVAVGVPQDQVTAALKADGYEAAGPDNRTDDEKAFDGALGAGAPEDYKISYVGRSEGRDAAELGEFNSVATAWLSATGFPPEIGPSVIERAIDVGQGLEHMAPATKELWAREQIAEFSRLAGSPEREEALMNYAGAVLRSGDRRFAEALLDGGALHDANVLMNIALQGERMAVRNRKAA